MLRTVVDSVPDSIFVKDRDGRFLMANKALAKAHGLTPEEVVGRHTSEMPGGSDAENEQLLAMDRTVLETGRSMLVPELSLTRIDGVETWRRIYKAPLLDAADEVIAVLGISEDVTERKR